MAIARSLAGRAKALPSIPEQLEWERRRVAEKKGGKDYYSIAPNHRDFFEVLLEIAGEPAAGTTGRKLPPFEEEWLTLFRDSLDAKIGGFQRKRARAEKMEADVVKAKL